jgi:PCFT/HCP family folate transporter-like MFS transporter 1/3
VLFGVLAGAEVLGTLACQIGMGLLFDIGLVTWPGLSFAMALLLAVIMGVTIWIVRVDEPTEHIQEGIEMRRLV